ncbi:hypothetical protein BJ741DRAFT_587321 [Chytriomyces cf. hyalinus JEL632]|nr:hypothetical protein BJ741DRAFT_587321 [Chytriomyces cf. hyalinus JEL632]
MSIVFQTPFALSRSAITSHEKDVVLHHLRASLENTLSPRTAGTVNSTPPSEPRNNEPRMLSRQVQLRLYVITGLARQTATGVAAASAATNLLLNLAGQSVAISAGYVDPFAVMGLIQNMIAMYSRMRRYLEAEAALFVDTMELHFINLELWNRRLFSVNPIRYAKSLRQVQLATIRTGAASFVGVLGVFEVLELLDNLPIGLVEGISTEIDPMEVSADLFERLVGDIDSNLENLDVIDKKTSKRMAEKGSVRIDRPRHSAECENCYKQIIGNRFKCLTCFNSHTRPTDTEYCGRRSCSYCRFCNGRQLVQVSNISLGSCDFCEEQLLGSYWVGSGGGQDICNWCHSHCFKSPDTFYKSGKVQRQSYSWACMLTDMSWLRL